MPYKPTPSPFAVSELPSYVDRELYRIAPFTEQQGIGSELFPRTDAERNASIIPVDYGYPDNDVRRDGAELDWNGSTGTDDHDAIASRISATSANGGTIIIARGTATASTISVPNGVILDFQWNQIGALADVPVFSIAPGGQVKNCVINCEGVTNYSSSAVKLVPTSNTQGDRFRPWFDGLYIRLDAYGFGTGVEYDCDEFYMQYMQASMLSVRFGARGVYMHGGDEVLEYCNGNTIHGGSFMDVQYPFDLDEQSNGNGFSNIAIEANTGSTIVVAGSSNRWSGICWDQVALSVSGQGNDFRELRQTTQYGTDITDTGIDNRSGSRGSEYYDKTSVNTSDDARHELYGPGKLEFRWFPLGGRGPYWTETQVAGAPVTAFGADIFGAAANNRQWMPYMNFTCAPGETLRWDFAGNGFVRAIQNPKVHCTNYTNAGDGRIIWRVGLYFDADNFILLEQDFGTHGDDNIRLITRAAATSTITSLGNTTAADRINFCSLLISASSVTAKVKQYDNAATGTEGRVGDGSLWGVVSNYFEVTASTNIPSTSDLEPYVYVDHGSGGSNAVMYLFDYQLVCGRKAAL
jgi:hypothetical protein